MIIGWLIINSFLFAEFDPEVMQLIEIISQRWNIQSLKCSFTIDSQNIETGEKTPEVRNKITYRNGNIFYWLIYPPSPPPSENKASEKKARKDDSPRNLLELIAKKIYGRDDDNISDENDEKWNLSMVSFFNGKYLDCTGDYYIKTGEENIAFCNECSSFESGECYAPWITRSSPLHFLGISFLPIWNGYYGFYSKKKIFIVKDSFDTPVVPSQGFYEPLIKILNEDIKKDEFPNLFKVFRKDIYRILLYDLTTTIWFDLNDDIVRIQQLSDLGRALFLEQYVRKYYTGEFTDFSEMCEYDYSYSEYIQFPDGVHIPMRIEIKKYFPIVNPDKKELDREMMEMINTYGRESLKSEKMKDLQAQSLISSLKGGMDLKSYTNIEIQPEELIVNEDFPDELFQIQLPENTMIYKSYFPNDGYYNYSSKTSLHNQPIMVRAIGYIRENWLALIFIFTCVMIVFLLSYITKKFFGWGI